MPFRERRRRRLRAQPLPDAWRDVLDRDVPVWRRLPEADRAELAGHLQVFLDEKPFEGCGGLVLTDEIRVVIAAEACVLLLHRDGDVYPGLDVIRVYPAGYVAPARHREGPVVVEGPEARAGESWVRGVVVLSWDAVRRRAHSGDVVFHEFAHQLDGQDGATDGAPILEPSMYAAWARVLGAEFDALRHGESDLDPYGATNPAEFFAVATEAFFVRSAWLKERHPELYGQLQAFYRQDPARWPVAAGDRSDGHGVH